jgi:Dolichyl-phosphate-mannose-protein mannosyltransferase
LPTENSIDPKIGIFIVRPMQRRVLFGLAIGTAIGLAAWCLMPDAVVSRRRDVDEAVYLMVARLLRHGYAPNAFFFDQFWLFPKTLGATFRIFGDSLIVGRLTVFGFSIVGVIGIAVLSYQLGARWAVPVAILAAAAEPLYLKQSRVAMSDIPSAACLTWALVLVIAFQKNRRRFWLALSGVCAAASLTLKPMAIGFVVSLVILVLIQRTQREAGRLRFDLRALAMDLLVFAAAGITTAAPFIDLLHPIDEYTRTIMFHLAERNWLAPTLADRCRALLGFTRQNIPWLGFAAVGVASLRPLPVVGSALLVGELLSTGILLQLPPWLHHYTLLVPLLVVFSVLGLDRGFIALKQTITNLRSQGTIASSTKSLAIMFVMALFIASIDLPRIVRYDHRARYPQPDHLEPALRYLEQNTAPGDYLLSDDVMIPYLANRLVPPSAINLTFAATFKFDQAGGTYLETTLRQYPLAGVIVSARYRRNPQLMSWIESNFPVSTQVGGDNPDTFVARIYSREKETR